MKICFVLERGLIDGTDHKCGICKTVLSSPRAKKTCFGVHEEVCIRYHFTLFYVGQSFYHSTPVSPTLSLTYSMSKAIQANAMRMYLTKYGFELRADTLLGAVRASSYMTNVIEKLPNLS